MTLTASAPLASPDDGLPPLTAWERIEQLADPRSFHETDRFLWSGDPLDFSDRISYERRLADAQAATHLLDAVVTGRARLLMLEVMLIVFDFRFLGGSMGTVVGEKVSRAFDIARRENRPTVVVASSGGARIQEGMMALFQMAKTAMAATRMRERGVPLVTVLADLGNGSIGAPPGSPQRPSHGGARVHRRLRVERRPPGRG